MWEQPLHCISHPSPRKMGAFFNYCFRNELTENELKPTKFKYRFWASGCAMVRRNTGLLLKISGSYRKDVRCFTAVL